MSQIVRIQCHYLHTGIKSHCQVLLSHFLDLFDVSFCYLENVGKYSVVCRIHQNL